MGWEGGGWAGRGIRAPLRAQEGHGPGSCSLPVWGESRNSDGGVNLRRGCVWGIRRLRVACRSSLFLKFPESKAETQLPLFEVFCLPWINFLLKCFQVLADCLGLLQLLRLDRRRLVPKLDPTDSAAINFP